MLSLLATPTFSQHPPYPFTLTGFETSDGQFRQQFFDPYGNAHGVYSYINPSGQVVRVQYSTGALPTQLLPFSLTPAPLRRYEPATTEYFVGSSTFASELARSELYTAERNATELVVDDLFRPAVVQFPAASAGQLENYRKALEQYAADATTPRAI